jgi:hypothetical protein
MIPLRIRLTRYAAPACIFAVGGWFNGIIGVNNMAKQKIKF